MVLVFIHHVQHIEKIFLSIDSNMTGLTFTLTPAFGVVFRGRSLPLLSTAGCFLPHDVSCRIRSIKPQNSYELHSIIFAVTLPAALLSLFFNFDVISDISSSVKVYFISIDLYSFYCFGFFFRNSSVKKFVIILQLFGYWLSYQNRC